MSAKKSYSIFLDKTQCIIRKSNALWWGCIEIPSTNLLFHIFNDIFLENLGTTANNLCVKNQVWYFPFENILCNLKLWLANSGTFLVRTVRTSFRKITPHLPARLVGKIFSHLPARLVGKITPHLQAQCVWENHPVFAGLASVKKLILIHRPGPSPCRPLLKMSNYSSLFLVKIIKSSS